MCTTIKWCNFHALFGLKQIPKIIMIHNAWYILCFEQYYYCRVLHVFLLGFSPTAVWGSVSLLVHLESAYSFVWGAHQIWGIYLEWFIYPWRHLRVSMWTSNVVMSSFKCFTAKLELEKCHPRNKWYFIQKQVYLHFRPVNFTYIWRLFYLSDDAQNCDLAIGPHFSMSRLATGNEVVSCGIQMSMVKH